MSTATPDPDRQVAELVLQIGRVAYADSASGGLTQAQWMALRFFARANRFSRTISAYAEFHATTRGTASQTVKSLESQGYLTRTRSERDRRSSRFDLTGKALDKLADDPLDDVVRAAAGVAGPAKREAADCLRLILASLAGERGKAVIGVCELCGHLDRAGLNCRLMREPLDRGELQELCVRFMPVGR